VSKQSKASVSYALSHPRAPFILETSSPPSVTSRQQIIPDLRLQLRSLFFLHVQNVKQPLAWVVMNRDRILCVQSQQSSVNYHGHYNKFTHTNHAVTRIAPVVPSAPCTQICSSINSLFLQWEGALTLFLIFSHQAKPNIKALTYNLCKSYNQWILLLLLMFFSIWVST